MHGVCGKDPQVAALQDLLIHTVKGLSMYAHRARQVGVADREINVFTIEALFTTITNVNFDPEVIAGRIRQAAQLRDKARDMYETACRKSGNEPEQPGGAAEFTPADDLEALVQQGEAVTIERRMDAYGREVTGLQELITYGLKGAAAYCDHAQVIGVEDDEVYARFHEMLDYLASEPADVADLTAKALEVGQLNLKVMGMLDEANTSGFGQPEPTTVRVTPVKGKCILVSGHDLPDLKALLEQTEGTGINVYTHGEMLPCHAYPELKKHKHLVGNYGGAWQLQRKEFDAFPGPILMTTNCLMQPKETYKDRVFTAGVVSWPGCEHVDKSDFSKVIECAQQCEGFTEDEPEKTITIGFAHNAVSQAADKVVELVKEGKIRHFFLIGGCDGAKPGRNYYTDLAQEVPDDCVILTLACGKYRFNKLEYGEIEGIPRLLDCGQCNDAYSAVRIAQMLAGAFDCGVNDLPLTLICSWYEQKAVAILLTLLSLGIENIRIGPTLPAFVEPDVLKVLVDTFHLTPVSTPAEDLQAALEPAGS
jgi:hydroxylamine reductase